MLTTAQAAIRLSVSTRRVQALIKAGRLPATKLGRDWLIAEADLAAVADRKNGRPPITKGVTDMTNKAGKNVWINEKEQRVKSETRPEGEWFPCYPASRVRGSTYTPYTGISAWERLANAAMHDEAAANHRR